MGRNEDDYASLGLDSGATDEEIDEVYERLKELYFPGETKFIADADITSPRFLEQTKAYRRIKRERKAAAKKLNDIRKINSELPVSEVPEQFRDVNMTDIYGINADIYREDGHISGDESQISSDEMWNGSLGEEFVQNRKGRRRTNGDATLSASDMLMLPDGDSLGNNKGKRRVKEVALADTSEINSADKSGIAQFLDFSVFNVEFLEEDRYYYKNAMRNIRDGNMEDAKRLLRGVTEQLALWSYLMGIISYFEHDYVMARTYALDAFTRENDNRHYWELVKFLEPYAEKQRDGEHQFQMYNPVKMRRVRTLIYIGAAILAIAITAAIITIVGNMLAVLS